MDAKDIKLDEDDDLFIDSLTGDFKISLSDDQHIQDIIDSFPGHYKEFPSLGVGIEQYLNSSGTEQKINREIKLQLQADGYDVSKATSEFDSNGQLVITPNAIRR